MISRVEIEMNLGWAEGNPELFVKAFREFQEKYPTSNWSHEMDLSRNKYCTLTATAKETRYDY